MFELERPRISKISRQYLPEKFSLTDWESIKPFYEDLKNRPLNSGNDLSQWLSDWSELESFLSEDSAWRYINFTRNTEDEEIRNKYLFFINELKPFMAPYEHDLNRKLIACPFTNELKD